MKKAISIFAAIFLILFIIPCYGQERAGNKPKLIIFFSPGCHRCMHIKSQIMPEVEKEFKEKANFEYRDIDDMQNYKLFLSLEEAAHAKTAGGFPIFYFEGRFLGNEGNVEQNLRRLLSGPGRGARNAPLANNVDLVKRFQGFTPLAIIAVGLIDGINPCAVTVIVFFMSFLAFQGYRKREIIVIGLLFIFSVYLTYVLIGLGIFEALYKLQGFWLLTKIINITVGCISILFSIYALYDFIQYRKTENTDDLLLSLPESIKHQIHKVIGSHYRAHSKLKEYGTKKNFIGLALAALITGFLVSVLEAVCVAKIYLPTIIFVLKTTAFKLKALIYLLLYNFLFVIPLLIILCFALAGTTSERFQKVLKGHLGTIKILMGIMFLGLGIFLIWRA